MTKPENSIGSVVQPHATSGDDSSVTPSGRIFICITQHGVMLRDAIPIRKWFQLRFTAHFQFRSDNFIGYTYFRKNIGGKIAPADYDGVAIQMAIRDREYLRTLSWSHLDRLQKKYRLCTPGITSHSMTQMLDKIAMLRERVGWNVLARIEFPVGCAMLSRGGTLTMAIWTLQKWLEREIRHRTCLAYRSWPSWIPFFGNGSRDNNKICN